MSTAKSLRLPEWSNKHINTGIVTIPMGDYYQENFDSYREATFTIDPSSFLTPLLARLDPPATILDVGCGSGRDMLWFKERGFNTTGFERSRGLAELARKHSGCHVTEGDFEQYDFSGLSVDAVVLVGALVHVPHNRFEAVLKNIARGLKQKGHALLTMKEGRDLKKTSHGRVFYLWQDSDLREIFDNLTLTVVDFARQTSKIRDMDIWLGYVLKKDEPNI